MKARTKISLEDAKVTVTVSIKKGEDFKKNITAEELNEHIMQLREEMWRKFDLREGDELVINVEGK